jgi:hypothetical protein
VRYLFGRLYARDGIAVRYSHVKRPLPSARLVWHELSSLTRMASDLQRAEQAGPRRAPGASVAQRPLAAGAPRRTEGRQSA